MQETLGGPVITTVHAKNAAGASHFSHCVESRVARNTSVVVLDLSQTSSPTDLRALYIAVRRAAPWASVLSVVWRPAQQLSHPYEHEHDAHGLGVDVLRVDHAARALVATNGSCLLYADAVHPSPEGHRLIGEMVGVYIAYQLAQPGIYRPLTAPGAGLPAALGWERCFADSLHMPVLGSPGRWRVVDEGRSGVPKPTLLSHGADDAISVGPLNANASCGGARDVFNVDLGYRTSKSWEYGAIMLACAPVPGSTPGGSCTCSAHRHYWSRQLTPFPLVQTNARLSADSHFRSASFNFTVTAYTSFSMVASPPGTRCALNIRHVASATGNASVVRIDSLAVSC